MAKQPNLWRITMRTRFPAERNPAAFITALRARAFYNKLSANPAFLCFSGRNRYRDEADDYLLYGNARQDRGPADPLFEYLLPGFMSIPLLLKLVSPAIDRKLLLQDNNRMIRIKADKSGAPGSAGMPCIIPPHFQGREKELPADQGVPFTAERQPLLRPESAEEIMANNRMLIYSSAGSGCGIYNKGMAPGISTPGDFLLLPRYLQQMPDVYSVQETDDSSLPAASGTQFPGAHANPVPQLPLLYATAPGQTVGQVGALPGAPGAMLPGYKQPGKIRQERESAAVKSVLKEAGLKAGGVKDGGAMAGGLSEDGSGRVLLPSSGLHRGIIPGLMMRQIFPQLNLTQVRIHTDKAADQAARALGARAFTLGRDIFFRAGRFQPESVNGLALLAHELVHVDQAEAGSLSSTFFNHQELEQDALNVELALLENMPVSRAAANQSQAVPGRIAGNAFIPVHRELAVTPVVPGLSQDGRGAAQSKMTALSMTGYHTLYPLKAEEEGNSTPEPVSSQNRMETDEDDDLHRRMYRYLERRIIIEKERRGIDR